MPLTGLSVRLSVCFIGWEQDFASFQAVAREGRFSGGAFIHCLHTSYILIMRAGKDWGHFL